MRRAGVFLLVLAFGLGHAGAAAPPPDVPAKYLEKEARIRAAMTPVARTHVRSFTDRLTTKMSVDDVRLMTRGEAGETLFLVMLDYLKLLNKEAREDHKIALASREAGLYSKEMKFQRDQKKIDEQKREAGERYDHAMQAATHEMSLGIVSGAASSAGTASNTDSGAYMLLQKTPKRAPDPHVPIK